MADKPTSPFAGLDKALLRSTKQPPSAAAPPPAPIEKELQEDGESEQKIATPLPNDAIPISVKPVSPTQEPKQSIPVRPYERSPVRQYARTHSSHRRHLIRHPFEFFEDQVDQLRRLALEAQLRGEKVSMSEMVREAIETYLQKKTRTPVR